MAFETLTIAGQIWAPQGLSRLFLPDLVDKADVCLPRGLERPAVRSNSGEAHSSHELLSPANRAEDHKRREDAQPCHRASPPSDAADRFMPVEIWPEVWREQLKDTRKARLAWTYWNLGPDLLALRGAVTESEMQSERRKERLQFLRGLLKDLGLPASTHTFWPPHLDVSEAPQPQPRLFWSGLRVIGCRGVVIMGSPAAKAVLKHALLKPLTQFREEGMIGWILWDIETFGRQADNYQQMRTYLRKVLQPFAPC